MYTQSNSRIENGLLKIFIERTWDGRYLSARLLSKFSVKYGTIEARLKLPRGRGTWPAFWLLSALRPLNWPTDGEIDVMEHVGYDQDVVHASIHTKKNNHQIGTQITTKTWAAGLSDNFHIYKLEWTPSRMVISLDNKIYFTYNKEANAGYDSWPFDNYFNIILNTAVGGWWGAAQGIDDSVFPQTYSIDYVKYTSYKGGDSGNVNNGLSWNFDSSTGFKWSMGCDWHGNDLSNSQISGDLCAAKCRSTPSCSHFTWNKHNGGTCWMKSGLVGPANAMNNGDTTFTCGYGIAWNDDSNTGFKWSTGCDFYGNDFTSVKTEGNQCASACKANPGCTHFTWNKANGGTCWMKSGQVAPVSAILNGDQMFVCGHRF